MAVPKVMGTEIEYGITVKGDPDFDPIASCVLLVNAYWEDHAGEILWDYDQENADDPRTDLLEERPHPLARDLVEALVTTGL